MSKIKKEQVFNKGCNLLVCNRHLKLAQLCYKWDDQSLLNIEADGETSSYQFISNFVVRRRAFGLDLLADFHRKMPEAFSTFLGLASFCVTEGVEVDVGALDARLDAAVAARRRRIGARNLVMDDL